MWSGNTLEERKTADIDGFRATDAAEEHAQRAFNSDGMPIVADTGRWSADAPSRRRRWRAPRRRPRVLTL